MHAAVVVLVCLASVGNGWKVSETIERPVPEQLQDLTKSPGPNKLQSKRRAALPRELKAMVMLLLANRPSAGWQVASNGQSLGASSTSHLVQSTPQLPRSASLAAVSMMAKGRRKRDRGDGGSSADAAPSEFQQAAAIPAGGDIDEAVGRRSRRAARPLESMPAAGETDAENDRRARAAGRRAARRARRESAEAAAATAPEPQYSSTRIRGMLPEESDDLIAEISGMQVEENVGRVAQRADLDLQGLDMRDPLNLKDSSRLPSLDEPAKPNQVDFTKDQLDFLQTLVFPFDDDRPEGENPYDQYARFIGRGVGDAKSGVFFLPYLQTGHLLLLTVLLLCSFISFPGFPLTTVPEEFKVLLRKGLAETFAINFFAAIFARGVAKAQDEPADFWFGKVLIFGGIALDELAIQVPEAKKAAGVKPRTGAGAR